MPSPTRAKALATLLGPEIAAPAGAAGLAVTGITADSRKAGPGMLFAALPGTSTHGARFIADAIAQGAVAILAEQGMPLPDAAVPVLRVQDPRRALALMAARFYAAQPEIAVAVTGTSGKTSVADFTRQIYASLGRPAASLGTLGIVKPSGAVYGSLTTPDPVALAATLADLASEGVTRLAFEASSHGLDQRRLDGVRLAAGAFTNLGRDHLDYHPSIESYLVAKLRLFEELLSPGQPAVIDADDAHSPTVIAAARARGLDVRTTGRAGDALKLVALAPSGKEFGQRLAVSCNGAAPQSVTLPLIGAYQASNALLAAGLVLATEKEVSPERVIAALAGLTGIKGRLEVVARTSNGLAVVDYAHKPEALEAALGALRPFATRRLICVFGCGGDRDKGKRPIMGRIAAAGADVVIVTDDNPRSEEPAAIRAAILAGAGGSSDKVREIGDRAEAIVFAVRAMGAGDVVLVAGKGHETGQIVGSKVIPFSDQDTLIEALRGRD